MCEKVSASDTSNVQEGIDVDLIESFFEIGQGGIATLDTLNSDESASLSSHSSSLSPSVGNPESLDGDVPGSPHPATSDTISIANDTTAVPHVSTEAQSSTTPSADSVVDGSAATEDDGCGTPTVADKEVSEGDLCSSADPKNMNSSLSPAIESMSDSSNECNSTTAVSSSISVDPLAASSPISLPTEDGDKCAGNYIVRSLTLGDFERVPESISSGSTTIEGTSSRSSEINITRMSLPPTKDLIGTAGRRLTGLARVLLFGGG